MNQNQSAPILTDLILKVAYGGTKNEPKFSSSITNYTLNVQSDISIISISPFCEPDNKITINNTPVKSGESLQHELNPGNNYVDIIVSDDAGQNKKYSLLVIREDIQPIIDKFQKLEYTDNETKVTLKYNLFVPDDYNKDTAYPLVLFLHGANSRGNDNISILTSNEGAIIWAKESEQQKRPCIVLAPQCPAEKGWISLMQKGWEDPYKPTAELDTVYNLLLEILKQYNIDKSRLYSTGLSMGGFGTFALNIKHPEIFAAMVIVCAAADTSAIKAIAEKPIWVFTAQEDPSVHVEYVEKTINALKEAGLSPRYTEYPIGTFFYPTAHYSWVAAYANEEMRKWLFEQKLV